MLSKITGPDGNKRIGLLGGSFNPPHDGHIHISKVALRRLHLDEVWWLVSPHNPLKEEAPVFDIDERLRLCSKLVNTRNIHIKDIERQLGTRYSIDTVRALQTRFPKTRFVWIMGADNLVQLPEWRAWTELMRTIPVAVVARPRYHLRACFGKAAIRFKKDRLDPTDGPRLPAQRSPAWTIFFTELFPISSTAIRSDLMSDIGSIDIP